MNKRVATDSELLVLHINATTMVIQSRSDPSKGVLVEHDGHRATKCHNAKCLEFHRTSCYHREECNKALEAQEKQQEEALDVAESLFTDWSTKGTLNNSNKAFSILR